MTSQEKKPVVITVAGAIVRGRAKRYRYVEPVVCELHKRKDGRACFKHLSRPCRARRSDRLAKLDAEGLRTQYEAEGRKVYVLDQYGSMHYKPVPESIVMELLQTEWSAIFPSHPEIARDFLACA